VNALMMESKSLLCFHNSYALNMVEDGASANSTIVCNLRNIPG